MRCAKYVKFILKPHCRHILSMNISLQQRSVCEIYNRIVGKFIFGRRIVQNFVHRKKEKRWILRKLKLESRSIVMTWSSNCVHRENAQ